MPRVLVLAWLLLSALPACAQDGNRLAYLDENNPYYVSRTFPKLTTPMWVGEPGVEAVVVLAIDDMRDPDRYEAYLRPILDRLKKIDGRAPVSIMTNQVSPAHPRLQSWLKEGLSLEVHTIDHPCPCLAKGDLKKATLTYEKCVDLMHQVPGNHPVAFRMPCCDSLNTVSPRFFAEVFNRKTAQGKYLSIDSSVFNLLTANDPALPRELVVGPEGSDRFRRYLPADRSFVNTVEDYPYPFVIGRLCWELPCAVPSDWEAQHLQRPNNPQTVADWKAVLDATVIKQGVMCVVFHPHNWIKNTQVVELIDHAISKHGTKVKFLNFREVQERLDRHLLAGQPLRRPDGRDNGVRLLDVDHDGYLDVVIGNEQVQQTRRWNPQRREWETTPFPTQLARDGVETGGRFGVVMPDGCASLLVRNRQVDRGWLFDGQHKKWRNQSSLLLDLDATLLTSADGRDQGVRFRDLDRDGCCELIAAGPRHRQIYQWSKTQWRWSPAGFQLPDDVTLVDDQGRDRGVRFVDVDEDGHDDVLVSNEKQSALFLFQSPKEGWAKKSCVAARGRPGEVPPITWLGSDRGAWFHSRSLWVQNEDTAHLKDHVDRRSFNELLQNVEPTAKSPEAALRSLQPRPGFVVELMAAEPLVQDPVAFAFGPDGKLWVVEMGDYPKGVDGKGKPGGRVKCLEDTKRTGKYDQATLFLDGLPFPTGVLPWKKGVLVTCAPDILYAEDTDGDGRADKREVLYRGFVEGNQQHRVNGLVRGLDNWIYGANGDSGGKIKSLKTGREVNISGRDFRIRPETGEIEAQTGQTQFGRCFDDWGNAFGCNNSNPGFHFVLADHYLRRNPHFTPPSPRRDVSVTPGTAPVYPISRTLPRFNEPSQANHFTSACGLTVYRDELFGPAFAGNLFVAEPVHNLVHREVMTPQGYSFTSRRAADEQRSEFLASPDPWFRPTMVATGPDGALWVADMYRAVIEHPEWIPPDWQKRLDLRAGHDRGRLYRVYPAGTTPRPIPRLDRLANAELVQALDSPSAWQRETAQQLLLDRNAVDVVADLERMVTAARPQSWMHALCTLDGLGRLSAAVLKGCLNDAHPGIRRHAVRLCEGRLGNDAPLGAALVRLSGDADAQVRLQLACTLGAWSAPASADALARLAAGSSDPYLSAAVVSSIHRDNFDTVLFTLLESQAAPAVLQAYFRLVPTLGTEKTWSLVFDTFSHAKRPPVETYTLLASLFEVRVGHRSTHPKAEPLFAAARASLRREDVALAERVAAAKLLGRYPDPLRRTADNPLLTDHLHPGVPAELQTAVLRALIDRDPERIRTHVFDRWKSFSPAVRAAALEAMLQRHEGLFAVVAALRARTLLPAELTPAQRMQLLTVKDVSLQADALAVFGRPHSDRLHVVDQFRAATTLAGDAAHGAHVFAKHCATCHRLNQLGHDVGPDLASLGDRSPEALLIAILDPNRAVETRYLQYVAVTKSGRTVAGILRQETSTSLTLVGPDGKTETLLRGDLDEFASAGKSAMPEGLESELKPQDLADLFAHVRGAGPTLARKVLAGNQPALIRPAADGALTLPAAKAEIYGPSLVMETQYGNLGYWQSASDHAVWEVEMPRPGRYDVHLEWACPADVAGNVFRVQAGVHHVLGQVASTGSWDVYRKAKVGELTLDAGRQRVTIRPEGKLANCLFDLKAVHLAPTPPSK